MKEGVFGLEITRLQDAINLRQYSWAAGCQRQLLCRERQILQLLAFIKIRQTIQCEFFCIR